MKIKDIEKWTNGDHYFKEKIKRTKPRKENLDIRKKERTIKRKNKN